MNAMLSRIEKVRLKTLITDTVVLLCKNGLVSKLKGEFSIEGLIGISVEEDDLMLVSINEKLQGSQEHSELDDEISIDGSDTEVQISRKKRRKRKHEKNVELEEAATPRKQHIIHNVTPRKSHPVNVSQNKETLPVISSHHQLTSTNTSHHQSSTTTIIPLDHSSTLIEPDVTYAAGNESETKLFSSVISAAENITPQSSSASSIHEQPHSDILRNTVSMVTEDHNYLTGDNSMTGESLLDGTKVSVKLENCDTDDDDDLIMVKHEVSTMSDQSILGGPYLSPGAATHITHIIPNQQAFSTDTGQPTITSILPADGKQPEFLKFALGDKFAMESTTHNDLPSTEELLLIKRQKAAEYQKQYRLKKKNDPEFRERERLRKKQIREERKLDPEKAKHDRKLANIRNKRRYDKLKASGTTPKKKSPEKVLSHSEHEHLMLYNRIRKQKYRAGLSGQKLKSIREKDRKSKREKQNKKKTEREIY